VQFDDVEAEKDQQVLEFDNFTVECSVKKGKVSFGIIAKNQQKNKQMSSDFNRLSSVERRFTCLKNSIADCYSFRTVRLL
jgi:hypothetical protein